MLQSCPKCHLFGIEPSEDTIIGALTKLCMFPYFWRSTPDQPFALQVDGVFPNEAEIRKQYRLLAMKW